MNSAFQGWKDKEKEQEDNHVEPEFDDTEAETNSKGEPKKIIYITDESGANLDAGFLQNFVFNHILVENNEDEKLFNQGGHLVKVVDDKILRMNTERIRVHLQETFAWRKMYNRDGKDPKVVKVNPVPHWICSDVVNSHRISQLPKLTELKAIPVLMPDGALVTKRGYIPGLNVYLTQDHDSVELMEFEDAKNKYLELFDDFPFEDDYSKGIAISYALTLANRHNINSLCPAYLSNSPTQGSGKGLLYHIQHRILYGRDVPLVSISRRDDAVTEKRWGQELSVGRISWMVDNLRQGYKFDDQVFAKFTTAKSISVDIKHVAEPMEVDNQSVIILTGNNVELIGDAVRRCVQSYLLPPDPDPDKRKLPNIQRKVDEHRDDYISALLSIWHHAYQNGLDDFTTDESMGNFEEWYRMLKFTTEMLGFDISKKKESAEESMSEVEIAFADFLGNVYAEFQSDMWKIDQIKFIALEQPEQTDFIDENDKGKQYYGILDGHINHKIKSKNQALGLLLKSFANRVFQCGELKLRLVKGPRRYSQWQVQVVE